jgi:oligoribonuclease NrnB/cAMP/cGMP phosphodiesterase (DHH superfamily)
MKPLIIYHNNCADGFGAAWAAYRKFGEDAAEYLPMNYNDPRVSIAENALNFPVEVVNRDVYILDFSFPVEVMLALQNIANKVFWRDHHKTAFEAFELDPALGYAFADNKTDTILDPNKSGCVLAWGLFHPSTHVPRMLQLIQDRDLWTWRMDGTRDFATALRSTPMTFKAFDHACEHVHILTNDGAAMNKLFDQQLADIVKKPVSTVLFGESKIANVSAEIGLSVNCTPQFSSEAGNALAVESRTFGMTWVVGNKGTVNVSLRSNGSYDVSALAKRYGGGGHRNAAGFKTTMDKLQFIGDTLTINL